MQLVSAITYNSNLQVKLLDTSNTSTITKRFPLGSYIKIDSEIMRVVSSTLTGAGNNEITVIRGAMGTLSVPHAANSLITKIRLLPFEFRRPSILRASGHTFEYLGYGPGNYSTGLPQLQKKTLSEIENFLSQSQQSSAGQVVYTGMNNNGDTFQGNTKISASSGEQVTFGIPIPTVTGQDPSRLSVVYDEVLVKERLLVEGGNSSSVLSQFNGPVTFNKEIKLNDALTANNTVKLNKNLLINDTTNSTTLNSGSFVTAGGASIAKNLVVGGSIIGSFNGSSSSSDTISCNFLNVAGIATINNLNVTGVTTLSSTNVTSDLSVSGIITSNSNVYGADLYANGSIYIINNKDARGGFFSNGGTDAIVGINNISNNPNAQVVINVNEQGKACFAVDTITFFKDTYVNADLYVTGDITAFYTSDQRLKENIKPIDNPLSKVCKISGVTFNWNELSGKNKEIRESGLIAQELKEVLPESVVERENGYLAVNYEKVVPLLVEAIKELKKEIEELKGK